MAIQIPDPPLESLPRFRVQNGGAIQNQNYSSGANWSVNIDRIDSLIGVYLRVDGVVSTGATPGTPTARIRNAARILGSRLSLKVNGKEEMAASPDLLLLRAQWRRSLFAIQSDNLTTAELASGSTSPTFSQQLPFDFCLPGVLPFNVGVLFGSRTPSIELSGTWGSVSDIMITPGATQALSSASLSLVVDRTRMNLTPAQAAFGFGHFELTAVTQQNVTATGTLRVEIPGGRAYSAIYIQAVAGSTPEPSNSVLTTTGFFRVRRGSDVLFEKLILELRNDTVSGLPVVGADTANTGWYVADFLQLMPKDVALMTKSWLTPGSQPLILEIDCTTSTGAALNLLLENVKDPMTSGNQRYNATR